MSSTFSRSIGLISRNRESSADITECSDAENFQRRSLKEATTVRIGRVSKAWSRRPPWLNPRESIGRQLENVGGKKCWEIIGVGRDLTNPICLKIGELLRQHEEDLNDAQSRSQLPMFAMYMVGDSEDDSNPTFIFSCTNRKLRQRALRIIRESRILENHQVQGVLLAGNSRSPLFRYVPQPLAAQDLDLKASTLCEIYVDSTYFSLVGARIFVSNGGEPLGEGQLLEARFGGLVCIQNSYFGMIANHSVQKICNVGLQNGSTDNNNSADVENGVEKGQEVEDDEFELYAPQDEVNTYEYNDLLTSISESTPTPEPPETSSPNAQTSGNNTGPKARLMQLISGRLDMVAKLGSVVPASNLTNNELDWALVKIEEIEKDTQKDVEIGSAYFEINWYSLQQEVAQRVPPTARIWTMASSSRMGVTGSLSNTAYYMQMPYGRTFQEVWVAEFDEALRLGDSGSWVIDTTTNELYGHIVAGYPNFNVAFIIPAKNSFQSIKEQLGSEVLLHN